MSCVCDVVLLRLVQSQAQPGPASAMLQKDSHRARPFVPLQEVLDDSSRFFRDFKHAVSPYGFRCLICHRQPYLSGQVPP